MEERVFLPFSNVHFAKFFLVFFFSIFFLRNFSHKFFFFSKGSFFQTDLVEVCFYLIFVVFFAKTVFFAKVF